MLNEYYYRYLHSPLLNISILGAGVDGRTYSERK